MKFNKNSRNLRKNQIEIVRMKSRINQISSSVESLVNRLDQMEDSINAEDKVVKLDCSVNKKEKKV
jgi:outer membrane murein-binding lipoprotein Lpp